MEYQSTISGRGHYGKQSSQPKVSVTAMQRLIWASDSMEEECHLMKMGKQTILWRFSHSKYVTDSKKWCENTNLGRTGNKIFVGLPPVLHSQNSFFNFRIFIIYTLPRKEIEKNKSKLRSLSGAQKL